MDNKPKGLADTGDADFILNESGTSVNMPKTDTNSEKFTAKEREKTPVENAANDANCSSE